MLFLANSTELIFKICFMIFLLFFFLYMVSFIFRLEKKEQFKSTYNRFFIYFIVCFLLSTGLHYLAERPATKSAGDRFHLEEVKRIDFTSGKLELPDIRGLDNVNSIGLHEQNKRVTIITKPNFHDDFFYNIYNNSELVVSNKKMEWEYPQYPSDEFIVAKNLYLQTSKSHFIQYSIDEKGDIVEAGKFEFDVTLNPKYYGVQTNTGSGIMAIPDIYEEGEMIYTIYTSADPETPIHFSNSYGRLVMHDLYLDEFNNRLYFMNTSCNNRSIMCVKVIDLNSGDLLFDSSGRDKAIYLDRSDRLNTVPKIVGDKNGHLFVLDGDNVALYDQNLNRISNQIKLDDLDSKRLIDLTVSANSLHIWFEKKYKRQRNIEKVIVDFG